VDFTFTASDNKIVIELNEDEAAIDGSTLNFTVREVRDEISSNLLGEQILEEKIKEMIYQRMESGEQILM
jgi:hypothetical protein